MKKLFYLILLLLTISSWSSFVLGQSDKSARPSPFVEVKGNFEEADLAIEYSSPAVKGRSIWGDLVPYDKVWRTGANEATTFETDKELNLGGEQLPAGKYALFTIPGESEWTWIFNQVWDQWGAFKYDPSKDVLRVTVAPESSPVFYEHLTFVIEENAVSLNWENLKVSLN